VRLIVKLAAVGAFLAYVLLWVFDFIHPTWAELGMTPVAFAVVFGLLPGAVAGAVAGS
jgi:hypothetical protein